LNHPGADAVLVMLVDTPRVGAEVVRRLVGLAAPDVLARASYDADHGHPVLIGREHWTGVLEVARGDEGAREYLRQRQVQLVDCSDVGAGLDVDTSEQLDEWRLS
jgi:nicotine blue oxidoreductase